MKGKNMSNIDYDGLLEDLQANTEIVYDSINTFRNRLNRIIEAKEKIPDFTINGLIQDLASENTGFEEPNVAQEFADRIANSSRFLDDLYVKFTQGDYMQIYIDDEEPMLEILEDLALDAELEKELQKENQRQQEDKNIVNATKGKSR